MATLGNNVRSVAPASTREQVRSFYTSAFGCECMTPAEGVDVFVFQGGDGLGIYFVPDEQALTNSQHRDVGTWIEVRVDDNAAAASKIRDAGGESFEYHDKEHEYFQAPGGQVFRLAK